MKGAGCRFWQLEVVLFVLGCMSFWDIAAGDPRTAIGGQFCADALAVSGPTLANNFVPAMDTLYANVSANGYGTSAVGQDQNAVFGLGQCLGDLSSIDCRLCFAEVRSLLPKCYPRIGGRLYLDGCFGRYGNYSFFTEAVDAKDKSVCSPSNYSSNPQGFADVVRMVIGNVTSAAIQNQGYAVRSATAFGTAAYALAQCWKSLNTSMCDSCLSAAAASVGTCAPATEGRALFAGCYIRYSTQLFWNVNMTGSSSSGNKNVVWIVVGSCLGVLLIILLMGILAWKKRIFWNKEDANPLIGLYGDRIPARIAQSNINFTYEELKKATNNFDEANKLGQGSYGTVYKAVLPDGKEVAVKRLFLNTRQWADQFFNEVELISQVRHKNLVKLLGCSVNGPESFLVYEYYFNKSLDLFLFDPNLGGNLTWEQRVDIIQGVAEGLSYLHEESEIRIIHRDIKASNILLDDKFKPKITDFGLARAFSEDITHVTTGVAGTLGYMAPEYIVHGHLTEKADVFSYGVLVLEIVTGKKCGGSSGSHSGHVLLTKVWSHYKANTIEMVVDESIYEDGVRDEILHTLQIGLLCTQVNPGDRPTMTKVVELLRSRKHDVQLMLSDPPFLNVETVEDFKEAENLRLLSTNSAPSLSGSSSRSNLSGR